MKSVHVLLRSCLALAVMACAVTASAATYEVSSIPDLQASINSAVAGDVIIVLNGVYTTSASITVNRRGTATDPIRIVAKTIGGVEITGTHGFNVTSPAAHVEIDGFLFTHISGRNQIRSGGAHIRFTRNFFECVGDGAYLTIAGHDAQVDRMGSPAIDSASGDYPAVVFDLDGQPRTGTKNKGADEYSTDPAVAEFLTPGAILRLIHGGGRR